MDLHVNKANFFWWISDGPITNSYCQQQAMLVYRSKLLTLEDVMVARPLDAVDVLVLLLVAGRMDTFTPANYTTLINN